ncbi:MAG: sigma-70 family RNA polymerase sigma factor [Gammaproteobacteria bacterium]|nr:sigma-70 family RNA polymerase sigma factor [Gammaproteobacteria bacterium]
MFDRPALNRLYRYAYTLCGDDTQAYDLLQDTVERCLQRPAGPLVSPEAYAHRVMRNRFIDMARRHNNSPVQTGTNEDAELLAIDTHCLEDLLINRDQLETIWSILDAFEREILYYWAVEDMTAAQIATVVGSRRGTVLSRIHRLRQKLRAALDGKPDSTGGEHP